ncbi:MAG: long-chain fatty acid--CoA ligase [Roseiflexaceae bacterium]|nr:long-chain fatty acid--CoA ligase [Roseiflexaceae bacterium]
MMLIGDWLDRRAQLSPEKVALIDALHGMRPITYRDWNRAANRTANFLRALGVERGDRVAILAHNCVEYLDLWFACGKIGAILQALNWRLTMHELAALIADAQPTVLVYGAEFAAQVANICADLPIDLIALDPQTSEHDLIPFTACEQYSDTPPPAIALDWNDAWVICYTGGSTGLPKGALLTHGSITWNAINTITSWGLTPDDTTILNAPLFHTGGLNVFTAPLVYIGGTSIVCRGFDAAQVFDLIRDAGVTLYFGVPTTFITLQQHPRWWTGDFSRLKLIISGGAPCPLPVFERFWERGVDFKTGYGLTEAGPNTFWLPAADVRRKPGAVGYPLMHIDLRIIAPDGQMCGPDQVGELQIRGPHVCAGYWNNTAETASAFVDGWLRTGDLASFDADRCYSIVGRLKDVIISGGENIYPAEVESVLAGHPAIAEITLIGIADPTWGEVGRAIIVVRPTHRFDQAAFLAYGRERLAGYKLPKSVVVVDSIPKTAAGKVDRLWLKQQYGL